MGSAVPQRGGSERRGGVHGCGDFYAALAPRVVLLSLVYGFITFQQPTKFAACLDIAGECAGAIVGAMNMVGQIGSFVSSLAFGYLVERYRSYDAPFVPMAVLLVIGAGLWLKVDPTERLVGRAEAAEAAV